VRTVALGRVHLNAAMAAELSSMLSIDNTETGGDNITTDSLTQNSELSPREREVLRCCLDGMSVTEIAENLPAASKPSAVRSNRHFANSACAMTASFSRSRTNCRIYKAPVNMSGLFNTTHPTVLVVDDSATSRFAIDRQLKKLGCGVTSASDGASALGVLATYRFDLVLLDCQMPDLDGYEVAAIPAQRTEGTRPIRRSSPFRGKPMPSTCNCAWTAAWMACSANRCRQKN